MMVNSLGAWPISGGVQFRVWAPKCRQIDVRIEGKNPAHYPLQRGEDGYFTGTVTALEAGCLYTYRLDGGQCLPDPCSRFQPQGPHGPSMVVDHHSYQWHDDEWQAKGIGQIKGQVIYELHVGTFSPEGNYKGLQHQLNYLKELGVTVIEIMPIAEFPGRWNWGYDGVGLFAPCRVYGRPDELKELIDQAHQLGLGVILDVVYNHFGPDGNFAQCYSNEYFTDKYKNEWGEAINFDGPQSEHVRAFFIENACGWINDFHFDGLRFDATQSIHDAGKVHILAEVSEAVRKSAGVKKLLLIAENESQQAHLIRPVPQGGYGLDGIWNDDFHHTATVALTGHREAYYLDYLGRPQDFISLVKHGFIYQGQYYSWQHKNRGTPVEADIPAEKFIIYLQNHDQVANSLKGERLLPLADAGVYRALTAYFLLSPQTPMLFMGQEFGASSPFTFFTDHHPDLGKMVTKGRKDFLSQFPSIESSKDLIPDPQDPSTFKHSVLNLEERQTHREVYQLHADLLKMRREDAVVNQQNRSLIDGAVLGQEAFVLRYKGAESQRLLIVNLGLEFDFSPCPEPLLAPLPGRLWHLLWSSEDVRYGGKGIVNAFQGKGWRIPGRCALVYSC